MSDAEKRIEALETQVHFFHLAIDRMTYLAGVVRLHETQIAKLEKTIKKLQDAASQGTP